MRAQDFVRGNIAYHSELNPATWTDNQMRPEVRDRLMAIAGTFVDYLEIPNFEVLDIVLTGSMSNYNWTRFSDFDLHVVTDYSNLQCDDLAEALYQAKKKIWNDAHNIRIRGHEVELYVEDIKQPPVSQGVFSVRDNRWLQVPKYIQPKISTGAVNHKVQDLLVQIKHALETADDSQDIKRITDKLRKMRRAGLDTGGEFSVENLAFKVIRNLGYLDRLSQATQDREFSMENMDHSKDGDAVEELRAALVAKQKKIQSQDDDEVYDTIDSIMTRIAKSHSISGQKLHDMWVDKYKQIPDTWIMK